jgi:hypothetical protein
MRPELERAVELVRKGFTYGETGLAIGLTRNQVAGACFRAGLKTGRTIRMDAEWRRKHAEAVSAGMKRKYADPVWREHRRQLVRSAHWKAISVPKRYRKDPK